MRADGEHTRADADAFRVLGWGLRRYAWLVVLSMLVLGVLIPEMLGRVPDRYEARAQVGPTEPLNLPNLDPLPRLGETVFNNGAVAAAIRQSFDPPLPSSASVIPERVELIAAQDNIIFTVVGHGPTPESAEDAANLGASTLTEELNKYTQSVGAFALQRLAETPAEPDPKVGGALAVGIGLLAGLVAGVGLVATILAWRRPIVDTGGAEAATGAPVFARVRLATGHHDTRGLPQLCHRLLSSSVDLLLVTGSAGTDRERRQLVSELTRVLGWSRPLKVVPGSELVTLDRSQQESESDLVDAGRELVIVDDPTQVEIATRPERSLTLLVVPLGIGYSSLRRQAEHHLDDGPTGLVLIHSHRWDPRTWRRLRRPRAATTTDVSHSRVSHHNTVDSPTPN